MTQNITVTEHFLATSGIHLEDVLDYIDQLHTAASEGNTQGFTGMNEVEVMSLLRDVIYTAQETIIEIEGQREQRRHRSRQPVLRIVPKIDRAG